MTTARVSASQIKTARGCMRRWAWERVDPRPPGPEQVARLVLGKEVHAVGEDYHKHGKAPTRATLAGRVFMPALPHVPPPGRCQTELEIRLDDPETLGYLDLIARAEDVPGEWPGCEHVILDYKTKNSFQARGMFSGLGDMLTDPQALVYSRWYFGAYPQASRLGLRWLYLRVVGRPQAKPCDVVISREQALEAYARLIEPLSRELIQLRTGPKPLDPLTLEPNPLECMRYGARYACPYISRCGLTPVQKLAGVMNMGLVDELRAQFGDKRINPPEGQPAQDKVSSPEPTKATLPEPTQTKVSVSAPDLLTRALRNACAAFVATVDSAGK